MNSVYKVYSISKEDTSGAYPRCELRDYGIYTSLKLADDAVMALSHPESSDESSNSSYVTVAYFIRECVLNIADSIKNIKTMCSYNADGTFNSCSFEKEAIFSPGTLVVIASNMPLVVYGVVLGSHIDDDNGMLYYETLLLNSDGDAVIRNVACYLAFKADGIMPKKIATILRKQYKQFSH